MTMGGGGVGSVSKIGKAPTHQGFLQTRSTPERHGLHNLSGKGPRVAGRRPRRPGVAPSLASPAPRHRGRGERSGGWLAD